MSNNPVLDKLFERHRIVFWYDANHEMRAAFDEYNHPQVSKHVVSNDEFGLKYRILVTEPTTKFLLYLPHAEPSPNDNWLLDIQLSNGMYRTDRISMWLDELELGSEWRAFVTKYESFFAAKERRERFKAQFSESTPNEHILNYALIAACTRSQRTLSDICMVLFNELHARREQGEDDEAHQRMRLMHQHGIDALLWQELAREYHYRSDAPSLIDFVYKLLAFAYAQAVRQQSYGTPFNPPLQLSDTAHALVIQWQDSNQYSKSFNYFSADVYQRLTDIRDHLESLPLSALGYIHLFREVDVQICQLLAQRIEQRAIHHSEVDKVVRQRAQSYWLRHDEVLRPLYLMLNHASAILERVNTLTLRIDTPHHGLHEYARTWHTIDYHYRHFVNAQSRIQMQLSDMVRPLLQRVDDAYTNAFLRPLNNAWQDVVNAMERWHIDSQLSQTDFFAHIVQPLAARKKVAVVVVDAMRYEIGAELCNELAHTHECTIQAVLGVLPSYTQLGQAALLPHTQLTLESDTGMSVRVDQRASAGLQNRRAILQQHRSTYTATTIEEFNQLNRDQRRDLGQRHDLIYVYHDTIDKTGENQEALVCRAACDSIQEIRDVIRSLMDANFSTVIITADHGFLYQQFALEEHEFMAFDGQREATAVFAQKRRMVIGRDLPEPNSLKHFTAQQLGLGGTAEVLIPYSINRLRLQGAQSRYVHGGASLQEIVVPVLTVHKTTKATGRMPVGCSMSNNIQNRITTSQFVVQIDQDQPVSGSLVARQIRLTLYARDGTVIGSGQPRDIELNSPSPNAQDRRTSVTVVLNEKAQHYNRQEVMLHVEEPVSSAMYSAIIKESFTLNRTIVADF
jgi:uncharacterized protein (TIGR02687 family)